MHRLEKDLGAGIFDRPARPLALTKLGQIFLASERRVAEIREDCRRAVQDINGGERGRAVFSAAHSGIEIAFEEGTTRELEDFVWTGKTDLSSSLRPRRSLNLKRWRCEGPLG